LDIKGIFSRKKKQSSDATGVTMLHKKLNFAASEAYKLLRTNLMFTLPDSDGCRIVGITSSIRGEGKSTTSINLSYSIAETGKKVLLIDADLRIPSVAKKLDIQEVPGLSNVLVEHEGFDKAIIHMPELDNWHVLPSGNIPPNPNELLTSSQMTSFVKKISQNYDFVIFDLPPVDLVSDALAISPLLDGMLLVVRENYLERRELNKCIKRLELSNVKVLGVVMNDADDGVSAYSRYKINKDYKSSYYINREHKTASTTESSREK
jgi:capsular exopolysaccharide synthesis family protein